MSSGIAISVLIPNRNRRESVLAAVGSVLMQNQPPMQVVVVDDHSDDGSVDAIRYLSDAVEVVELDRNVGPAAARNAGLQQCRGEIVVGIDSDVVLYCRDTLGLVAETFVKNPGISGLAFRILRSPDGEDDAARWWHPLPLYTHSSRAFYTDYFSGSGYALKREVFEEVGYYPSEYFIHFEEVDLSLRIIDSGRKLLYTPDVKVWHKAAPSPRRSLIAFYYKRRNQIWLTLKYYPVLKGFLYLTPRLISTFCFAVVQGGTRQFFRGIVDAVRGAPLALAQRRVLRTETWRIRRSMRKGHYVQPSV